LLPAAITPGFHTATDASFSKKSDWLIAAFINNSFFTDFHAFPPVFISPQFSPGLAFFHMMPSHCYGSRSAFFTLFIGIGFRRSSSIYYFHYFFFHDTPSAAFIFSPSHYTLRRPEALFFTITPTDAVFTIFIDIYFFSPIFSGVIFDYATTPPLIVAAVTFSFLFIIY